jgi:hypothetical protein
MRSTCRAYLILDFITIVNGTSCEAPHYAVFCSLLPLIYARTSAYLVIFNLRSVNGLGVASHAAWSQMTQTALVFTESDTAKSLKLELRVGSEISDCEWLLGEQFHLWS